MSAPCALGNEPTQRVRRLSPHSCSIRHSLLRFPVFLQDFLARLGACEEQIARLFVLHVAQSVVVFVTDGQVTAAQMESPRSSPTAPVPPMHALFHVFHELGAVPAHFHVLAVAVLQPNPASSQHRRCVGVLQQGQPASQCRHRSRARQPHPTTLHVPWHRAR